MKTPSVSIKFTLTQHLVVSQHKKDGLKLAIFKAKETLYFHICPSVMVRLELLNTNGAV